MVGGFSSFINHSKRFSQDWTPFSEKNWDRGRQVFQGLDTDGSGTLTRQELADVPVPWSHREVLEILERQGRMLLKNMEKPSFLEVILLILVGVDLFWMSYSN